MMYAVIACVVAIASLVSGQANGKTMTVCCSIFYSIFVLQRSVFLLLYTISANKLTHLLQFCVKLLL